MRNTPTPVTTLPAAEMAAVFQQHMDPYGMMTSVLNAQAAWLMHPQELSKAANDFFVDAMEFQTHLMRRSLGLSDESMIKSKVDDVRFADPDWEKSPAWDVVKECYLAFTHRTEDLLFSTPGLSDMQRRRAAFWAPWPQPTFSSATRWPCGVMWKPMATV
ncbi:MAG: polyhydroxyalkanoate synthase [Comamonadaceae bacterium]|nr:MAG: polyhydroxyalkanoate synthase [Comamonadaceae bacterium]